MKTLSACLSVLLLSSIAEGQAVSTNPLGGPAPRLVAPGRNRPQDFGVGNQQSYTLAANTMTPLVSDTSYGYTAIGFARFRTGGSVWFQGPVTIPTGALVTGFEIDGCDTSASATVDAFFFRCPNGGDSCELLADVSSGSTQTPGCSFFFSSVANHTIDQLSNSYHASVALTATDSSARFSSIRVYWQRQLSPAPLTATFGDVPTSHPFFRVIEALNASGVTTGCGNGNFCPDGVVTRQEVAKFLARALGLAYNDGSQF